MCTAINDGNLFGRTLDLDRSFGERIIITPRNKELLFLHEHSLKTHLSYIGMALKISGTALYFDGVNECGLGMAGLNFPENAVYHSVYHDKSNIASFELIPWILSQCESLPEAVKLLEQTNVTADNFSGELPSTPLHWIVADKRGAVTVESVSEGLKIYDNPFGVLTNNPPFNYHTRHVAEYMYLNSISPKNTLCPDITLDKYGGGFGAIGLPGDFSPASRFVRAVFAKSHTSHESSSCGEMNRFFHIMDTVAVPKGCTKTKEGRDTFTVYTSCADREALTYNYTTYDNRTIRSVSMIKFDLDTDEIIMN